MISFVRHNQLIDRWMIHQKSSWCVVLVFWGVGLGIVPWTTSILIGLKANIHTHSVPVRVTGQKRHWPLDLWPNSCLKANNVLARFDQSEFLFIFLWNFIGCFLDHQSSGGKHKTEIKIPLKIKMTENFHKFILLLCCSHLTHCSDGSSTTATHSLSVSGVSNSQITTDDGTHESCYNETWGCSYNPEGPLVRCDFL